MTQVQLLNSQLSARINPPASIANPDDGPIWSALGKHTRGHYEPDQVIDLCDDEVTLGGDESEAESFVTQQDTKPEPSEPVVPRYTARKEPRLALNPRPVNRNDLAFTLQSFTDCFPNFPFDPSMLFSARFQDRNQVNLNDVAYYRCKDGFLLPLLAVIVDCGAEEIDLEKPRPGQCFKFRGKQAVGDSHMVICPPHSNDYALYERVMRILYKISPYAYAQLWARCHIDWRWFHGHQQEIAEAVVRYAQDSLEEETTGEHDATFLRMMYKGDADDEHCYLHPYHWEEDCFCYPSAAGKPYFNISFDFVTFPPRPPISGLHPRIFRPVMWTDIHNI